MLEISGKKKKKNPHCSMPIPTSRKQSLVMQVPHFLVTQQIEHLEGMRGTNMIEMKQQAYVAGL